MTVFIHLKNSSNKITYSKEASEFLTLAITKPNHLSHLISNPTNPQENSNNLFKNLPQNPRVCNPASTRIPTSILALPKLHSCPSLHYSPFCKPNLPYTFTAKYSCCHPCCTLPKEIDKHSQRDLLTVSSQSLAASGMRVGATSY